MRKLFVWIIYLLGLYFTGTALHELFHFYQCGGSFVAGLSYLQGEWYLGSAWCEIGRNTGEWLPTTLEVLFYVVGIVVKAKT